jgi:metal-sulfur cluster biosynthetic enzyme
MSNITKEQIIEALKTVKDPEVKIDIWTMGLIYQILIGEDKVKIVMTYTTPFCPWGPLLQTEIQKAIKDHLGIENTEIELTFDPPYKMPDELRAMLGI